jgi:hypothetical protein
MMAKAKAVTIERKREGIERSKSAIKRAPTSLSRTAPDFESLFDDGVESLFAGVEFSGDLQEDSDATMSTALREIIERKKASQERFRVAIEPDFYFCVCFQSREQKDEFLKLAGWEGVEGARFVNGLEIARQMDIPIEAIPIAPLKLRGKVTRYAPGEILRKGE